MTVYIPQVMDYNVRSAEKFGDLKIMLPDRKQMILASGPLTAIIGLCCAIAAEANNGKFKVLKWDRNDKRYYDLEIDLRGNNE